MTEQWREEKRGEIVEALGLGAGARYRRERLNEKFSTRGPAIGQTASRFLGRTAGNAGLEFDLRPIDLETLSGGLNRG